MSYYRFPINLWMQYVTRCMPVPSNHSNVRIQGLHERVYKCARSTPVGSILELLKPFFDFVDEAIDSGRSVLVHCVAGAHRAATAGCMLLMHYHQLGAKVRVQQCTRHLPSNANTPSMEPSQFVGAPGQDATTFMRKLRPVTEPKGALQQLLEHYERAVGVECRGVGVIERVVECGERD